MDLGADSLFKPPRRGNYYVRLVPPSRHLVPSVTGGLRRLYEKIKKQRAILPFDCESYTNSDGSFGPVVGMPLLVDRYDYLEVIGQGQSSILLKAKDTFQGGRDVAIKILHTHYSVLGSQEANCLQSLNSADPHGFSPILRLLTTFSIGRHFCLVFELLHCVPLASFFQQKTSPQERLRCVRKVALRLINAVGFLQSQNVIHADLKPDNLRLSEEGELASLKVVDFGNAIHCIHDELSLYYEDFELQTLLYRAPEVIFGLMFGVEVDLWSVGCILAELYVGQPLFHGRSMEAVLTRMQTLLGPLPKEIFQRGKFFQTLEHFTKHCVKPVAVNDVMQQLDCSNFAFIDFLLHLLKFDPASRMTVEQAAEHPFLAAELGLKYFQMKPCYESNANYPKTFLTPETYRHSQKRLRWNGNSDLSLSPSTLQNLEMLNLPKALKFLPRKIELLSNSGIMSTPDVIGQALGGLSSAEKSKSKRKSVEILEKMDNNNGSFPRLTVKMEPVEMEFGSTTVEAEVNMSGAGRITEISRTGQRSTERPGLDGSDRDFVLKELRGVSTALSDAVEDTQVIRNLCNFQQRRFNVDHIHKTSDTEHVTVGGQSGFDKLPNGFVASELNMAVVLPREWEVKDKRELDFVKLKNLKHNPPVVMVAENGQETLGRSLDNGVWKMGKKDLSSRKSPGNRNHFKVSLESLLKVDNRNKTTKCANVVPNCESGLEVLHSQAVLEESNLVSSQSNGQNSLQTSQSTEDVRKRNGTFPKKDIVSNPEGIVCTPLSEPATRAPDNVKEIPNCQKVGVDEKEAPRKDSILFDGSVQITEESALKTISVDVCGGDVQQNVVRPIMSKHEIWRSLSQNKSIFSENSSTVPDKKNTSVEEKSIELEVNRMGDRFKPTRGQSRYKLYRRGGNGALKKSACDPREKFNSGSLEVLEDVEGTDSSPERLSSSRELVGSSVHQLREGDRPRRLPVREEPERKSSLGCVGQKSSSCDKRQSRKNSHLDSTFIIEDHPDVRRTPGKTPEKRPLQRERIQPSKTVDPELPPNSSSCRKKAKNTNSCLDVTFSGSPNHRKGKNLETSREHAPLSSSDSLMTADPELPLSFSSSRKQAKNTSNCVDVTFSSPNPHNGNNCDKSRKLDSLPSSNSLVTADPELPLNTSSCQKKAKNKSNCLDVTFSKSPCKDKILEMSFEHDFLSSSDHPLVTNSQKLNYVVPAVLSRKSFKSPKFRSSFANTNVPEVHEKESANVTQEISTSDRRMSPPKKRRKLLSETENLSVVLPTEPNLPCINAVACSADSSNRDHVDSLKLASDNSKEQERVGGKKIAVRGGVVNSRNSTVTPSDLQFCKSPLNETFQLDKAFAGKELMTCRWQHNQTPSPGGAVERFINKTESCKSYKFVKKCTSKQMMLYCYPGKRKDTSDTDRSESCELDRSGYTVNKASLKPVNTRSPNSHSASTACFSDDEEDDNDDEVVVLTP